MKIIPTSSTTKMNTQLLKDRLTIVIPCKNEGVNIYECLGFISKQRGIAGTRVIISDNSDNEESLRWIYQTESDYKYSLKIEVIEGGFPAQARLNGSKLVTTPYMLFLDADIMLFKQGLLETVVEYEKDLVTVPFETETGFNWIFRMFDITQRLSVFLGTPFAVGGFQLFKMETYWNIVTTNVPILMRSLRRIILYHKRLVVKTLRYTKLVVYGHQQEGLRTKVFFIWLRY